MLTILLGALGAAFLAGLAVFVRYNMAIKRAAREKEEAARALSEKEVQCFSCGMVVAKETALEKNGRYFCGVKRNDRNGRPVRARGKDSESSE
jgi:hypothetical protein